MDLFDLNVYVNGDLDVDCHHTVEDTGYRLGTCDSGSCGGQNRVSADMEAVSFPWMRRWCCVPVDLSGRPYYVSDAVFSAPMIGELDTETISEFFYAVSYSAAMNLHFKVLSGTNSHHIC